MTISAAKAFINVEDGYKVWTKSIGGSSKNARTPLLVLHGGPGMAHDYLDNLEALASDTQKVVFYDQLGCGRSDTPNDPQRWKVPRFVTEVDFVRNALHLDEVVILGQSWGGMLALEYFLTQPKGVQGGILSNSLSSAPLLSKEIQRLLRELLGAKSSPDENTVMDFYSRHILRLQPFPKKILQKMEETNQVYETMWGKNEFTVTGNLKDWDRTSELPSINSQSSTQRGTLTLKVVTDAGLLTPSES